MIQEDPVCGTVYDDVFRTIIDKMPHLVIPLVNEVFSRQYPDNEPVIALQNEHMELLENKVITDSYLKIADGYYHLECQSNPDGTMAIRMIEYDFLIALKHAEKNGYEYTIKYPDSCVLYLRYTKETPDFLTVHIKFPCQTIVDYQTPVIKVGQYNSEDIFEKKLLFFLPYYIMKYEKMLPEIEANDEKLLHLLKEYQSIYNRLWSMRNHHNLSEYDFAELKSLIEIILEHVAGNEKRILEGVKKMGGKVLEFEHDRLIRQGETRGEVRGEARGSARSLVNNVESIMRTLHVSLEKACELLETTVNEYQKARQLISK